MNCQHENVIFKCSAITTADLSVVCMIGDAPLVPARVPVARVVSPGEPDGDVAVAARVHDLDLEVVCAGGERRPRLRQTHVDERGAAAHVLQHRPVEADVVEAAPVLLAAVDGHGDVLLRRPPALEAEHHLLWLPLEADGRVQSARRRGHQLGSDFLPVFGEKDRNHAGTQTRVL